MNEIHTNTGTTSSTGLAERRGASTSLFGGAMLATVATASLAQSYFSTAGALNMHTVASGYVVLGANAAGDDGGGVFRPTLASHDGAPFGRATGSGQRLRHMASLSCNKR
jgi:hypothetical protein